MQKRYGIHTVRTLCYTCTVRCIRIPYPFVFYLVLYSSVCTDPILYFYFIFSACPPCKLKLFTWSQTDHMIDFICQGPEYNTKLKVITEDKDVENLKQRAARERGKADRGCPEIRCRCKYKYWKWWSQTKSP